MGNFLQSPLPIYKCTLCNTTIEEKYFLECGICNVYFHKKCYGNQINKRGLYNKHARYTQCPMKTCQRIGVISTCTYINHYPTANIQQVKNIPIATALSHEHESNL